MRFLLVDFTNWACVTVPCGNRRLFCHVFRLVRYSNIYKLKCIVQWYNSLNTTMWYATELFLVTSSPSTTWWKMKTVTMLVFQVIVTCWRMERYTYNASSICQLHKCYYRGVYNWYCIYCHWHILHMLYSKMATQDLCMELKSHYTTSTHMHVT